MDERDVLSAAYSDLERLTTQFLEAIEDIPDDDLSTWKPVAEQLGGGAMSTFSGLANHVVAAARWRIEQQVFDCAFERDRESEFSAKLTRTEIGDLFATMLANFRELIDSGEPVDLASLPTTPRDDHPDWTRYDWLMTAVSHTALHLGHAQIHRQLWLAESANAT